MILVAVALYLGAVPGEDQLLDSLVDTGPNLTLDEWRESFKFWAWIGFVVAAGAAVLWFIWAQWGISLNYWGNVKNKRWTWLLIVVFPLGAVMLGYLRTPTVQDRGYLATGFYLLNNVVLYYLLTLLFSPSSFKYTPLGAAAVRRWW
jgi:hypothetical protein